MNDCNPNAGVADTMESRPSESRSTRAVVATITPRLIPIEHTAAYIGVSVPTAERMHACDELPLPVTLTGRRVLLWDVRELDAWLDRLKPDGSTYTRKEWIAIKAANRRA